MTGAVATEVDPGREISTPARLPLESGAGLGDAFGVLVAKYHERIYNFLLGMTRQPHDAEDLTQETFLKAWRAFARFNHEGSASTWLFIIAKRTAYNHFRSHRPVADPAEAPEPTDGSDPSSVMSQNEEKHELWRLARNLKPNQYQVLWLRYGEGFSVAETAKIMGAHPIQVRVLLHRGRNQLAKMLKRQPRRESRDDSAT